MAGSLSESASDWQPIGLYIYGQIRNGANGLRHARLRCMGGADMVRGVAGSGDAGGSVVPGCGIELRA